MNQVKAKFSIIDDGEGLDVDIEGTRADVIIALATLIEDNKDVKEIFEVALLLVNEYSKGKETSDEDIVAMMSKIKPIAQA